MIAIVKVMLRLLKKIALFCPSLSSSAFNHSYRPNTRLNIDAVIHKKDSAHMHTLNAESPHLKQPRYQVQFSITTCNDESNN